MLALALVLVLGVWLSATIAFPPQRHHPPYVRSTVPRRELGVRMGPYWSAHEHRHVAWGGDAKYEKAVGCFGGLVRPHDREGLR